MILDVIGLALQIETQFNQVATNIINDKFPEGDARISALSTVALGASLIRGTFSAANIATQVGTGASFAAEMAPVMNAASALGLGANLAVDVMRVSNAIDAGNQAEINDALGRLAFGIAFAAVAFAIWGGIGSAALWYVLGRGVYDHLDDVGSIFSNLLSFLQDFAHSLPDLTAPLQQLVCDPLILDLDGDGIEVSALDGSSVHFDYGGDGFAERTGWVSPDDGLLVIDDNANGRVDGAVELFGSATQDGFAVLETLDGNRDGVIDAQDAAFAKLRVWRDLNRNGVSEEGELQTLAQAGIASIVLKQPRVASCSY